MTRPSAPSRHALRRRKRGALLAIATMALPGHPAVAEPSAPPALATGGIDHVGINVPDADAAIAFYRALLGAVVVSDVHPDAAGAGWKRRFRWHDSARLRRLVMLALPGGARIELFEYDSPDGSRDHPHQDDAGATHIALKASDPDHCLAVLRARGVTVLNDPVALPDGTRWFYFLTPWGSQMELVFP